MDEDEDDGDRPKTWHDVAAHLIFWAAVVVIVVVVVTHGKR